MKQKTRVCRICKTVFPVGKAMYPWCSIDCQVTDGISRAEKKRKEKKTTARRELIAYNRQDIKKLTKTAKQVMQEYVRLRDIDEPCISCRKPTAKQWDGGHYMSAEFHKAVVFNTLNIHKQCSHCNDWNNENKQSYRIHLIEKIGLEKVEWLEAQKGVMKYNAEYLNKLIRVFRKKVRILKKKIDG